MRRTSPAQHGAGAHARRTVDMCESDARRSGHLVTGRAALELTHYLVHLPQARGADRLAVGQAPAIRVHWNPPSRVRGVRREQCFLLAVGAETRFGEMNDLGA